MSFKNIAAERTTVTRDTILVEEKTGNIYESLVAISKRANQISSELKEELTQKLQEFATHSKSKSLSTTKKCQSQLLLPCKSC